MKEILRKTVSVTFVTALLLLSSCSNLFNDPLTDKETGEKLTLLLVDYNAFLTTFTVEVVDASTGEEIDGPVKIYVGGKNGGDIVDLSGYRKSYFESSINTVELALDPAITPSQSNEVEVTFTAEVEGYESLATSKKFTTEGNRTVIVQVVPKAESDEEIVTGGGYSEDDEAFVVIIKSTPVNSLAKSEYLDERPYYHKINISVSNMLKFKDSSGNCIFSDRDALLSEYGSYSGDFVEIKSVTTSKNVSSMFELEGSNTAVLIYDEFNVSELKLAGKSVAAFNGAVIGDSVIWDSNSKPTLFGFFNSSTPAFLGEYRSITAFSQGVYVASGEVSPICSGETTVTFNASSIKGTAFVFSLMAEFENNAQVEIDNFTGVFNQTFTCNRMVDAPVKLSVNGDYFAFKPIVDFEKADYCGSNLTINVEPASGYEMYEVALVAICPDNQGVGVSPSISAKYRPAGETFTVWQNIRMIDGVVKILAKPSTTYTFKLPFEDDFEYFDLSTNISENNIDSNTTVEDKGVVDGVHKLKVTHLCKQSVCNSFGW